MLSNNTDGQRTSSKKSTNNYRKTDVTFWNLNTTRSYYNPHAIHPFKSSVDLVVKPTPPSIMTNKHFLLLLSIVVVLFIQSSSGKPSFTIDYETNTFLKDGAPFRYVGGSVHYWRIPRSYWRDRLEKMAACGLDVVTTYVHWALHEPTPGELNFQVRWMFFLTPSHLYKRSCPSVRRSVGPSSDIFEGEKYASGLFCRS